MKISKKQILVMLTFIIMLILGSKVYGASASITPSSSNVTVGTTVNITVGVQGAESWNLKLTPSGGTLGGETTSADAGDGEVTKTVMNATFSASTPGTYNIILSGTVASTEDINNRTKQSVNKSIAITVKAPQVSKPTPTPTPTPKPTPTPTPVTLTFSNASGTMYTTSSVNFRSSYGTSASRIGTISAGEEVTITAKSNEKLNNEYWSKVTYKGKTGYVASSFLTATKPEVKPSAEPSTPPSTAPEEQKSNDSSLKSLSITGVEITPAFDSRIFNYDANILDTTITEVEVLAEVNDEKAKYEIIGNTDLKNGENIISVAVTAEDGTVSRYDIKLIIGVIETPSPEPTPVVAQTTNESPLSKKQIAIIAGIVVGAVLVIILLVRHHRKQDDLDYGETDYSFLKNDEEIQNKEKDRRQEFLDGFDNNDDDDKRKGGKHF